MQIVRFTKFWSDLSVAGLGERAKALGYDGLDLAVRAGHAVNPQNVGDVLSGAVRAWAALGVTCAMISGPTDLLDAESPAAQRMFEAAANAGVPRIKIGYFKYTPGADYWALVDEARRALARFSRLSERTGVQTLYHTHSGMCLGSNCAALMHLLDGCDPAQVGAYADLGHLAINGEDVALGLPMVRAHLAAVGVKDARHVPDARPNARAAYGDAFVPVGQGAAEWRDAVRLLLDWGFDGPLTVHTEYTTDQDVLAVVGDWDHTPEAAAMRLRGERDDLAYVRRLLAEVAAEPIRT